MTQERVCNRILGALLFLAYFALLGFTAQGGQTEPAEPVMAEWTAGSADTPRLALVFDDWGYAWEAADEILGLPAPITVAVIPHLPYSVAQAKTAAQRGHEVILHLPMTPENAALDRDGSTIGPRLETTEITARVRDALDAVPGIVGVNNHMGSLGTSDERVVRAVLEQVGRRGLFFLDSHTTGHSVVPRVAEALRVPYAVNRLFLDGIKDPEYVKGRMEKAIRIAEREGSAIAIGHVRMATYRGIAAMLPEIERRGVQLVPLSHLVRRP